MPPISGKKRIAIFGSTGSIGVQALDVIRAHADLFSAEVLTAQQNDELLVRQALEFQPNVVVIGTREKAQFDMKKIAEAEKAQPDFSDISNKEMFNARPRTPGVRYIYDRGPSEDLARIMKENLDMLLRRLS